MGSKPTYWWNLDKLKQHLTISKGKRCISHPFIARPWAQNQPIDEMLNSWSNHWPFQMRTKLYQPPFYCNVFSTKPTYWWNAEQLKQPLTFSNGNKIVSATLSLQCHGHKANLLKKCWTTWTGVECWRLSCGISEIFKYERSTKFWMQKNSPAGIALAAAGRLQPKPRNFLTDCICQNW